MSYCPTCNGRFTEGTFCPKDGTSLMPDGEETKSLVGQVIGGRYRLTKLLGQGGMGEVYAGEHIHITKQVAVKLLHQEIHGNEEALVRFRQEAQSSSSIGHDNIVVIDDFGQMDDGRVYLCMEFLEGESLNDLMQAPGGLDPVRAIDIMLQVCEGLTAAHAKGIIHRDMKPENVFVTHRSDGSDLAKILDFGIAKVSGTDENQGLTKTGTVFGTPHYMSPEQALGQKLDHRADVYSVGVMLFEMFTGQVPFKAESFMGILSQHITKPAPQPSTMSAGRSIPRPIEDIILKAMAKEPGDRYGSMAELGEALRVVRAGIAPGAAATVPKSATLAFGSGPGPAAAAGAAAGGAAMATGGQVQAAGGQQPAVAPTMAAMPTGAAPQAGQATPPPQTGPGQAALQPGPVTPPPQTGPGPAAEAPIPKTMMAGTAGAPVAAGVADVPVVPRNAGLASPPPAKKKSKAGLFIGLGVGLVLLLGGGAAAGYFLWYLPNQAATLLAAAGGEGGEGGTGETSGSGSASSGSSGSGSSSSGSSSSGSSSSGSASSGSGDTGSSSSAATTKKGTEKPEPKPKDTKVALTSTKDKPEPTKDKPEPTKDKPEPTKDKPEPKPEPKAQPKPKPEPKPQPKITPKPKPKPKPLKTHVEIRIVSVPKSKARLRLGGRKTLGYTPKTLKLKRGERLRILVARGGFADKWINITADRDKTVTVRLSPRRPGFIPGANPGGMPGSDPFN